MGVPTRAPGETATRLKGCSSAELVGKLPEYGMETNEMGLGPPILALYRQIKMLGALDEIDSVVELGSQGVWCPDRRLLTGLFVAFGRPLPPDDEL